MEVVVKDCGEGEDGVVERWLRRSGFRLDWKDKLGTVSLDGKNKLLVLLSAAMAMVFLMFW